MSHTKQLQVRVSPEVRARLARAATYERRTMSNYARIAIEDALSRTEAAMPKTTKTTKAPARTIKP